MKLLKYFFIFYFILSLHALYASNEIETSLTEKKPQKIYVFSIKEEIAKPAWISTQKAFTEAKALNADLIIIHLNTYGGILDIADSIRTKILNSPLPVWVFIDNNAASAGALISIACDKIFMSKGATIGAATVVNPSAEALPDKYQSYMRAMMRATAIAKNRNPDIAEAMVDPDIEIEGITEKGKVLTLTTSEAIKLGFCDAQAETIEELLKISEIKKYDIVYQELSAVDKIKRFFVHPIISGLLIMIIIGGIYFELQTPGIGFPLIAAIIAALLYFVPLYIEGLVEYQEIILFVIGIVLLGVELFLLPGFGIPGILGIIALVIALALALIKNDGFHFPAESISDLIKALALVLVSSFLGFIASLLIAKKTTQTALYHRIALTTEENVEQGYTSADQRLQNLIGMTGIAASILRPSGKIIINNDLYDATAETGYIEKGEKVQVTNYENMQLLVRKIS